MVRIKWETQTLGLALLNTISTTHIYRLRKTHGTAITTTSNT